MKIEKIFLKQRRAAVFALLFCATGLSPQLSLAQLAANKSKFVGNIIGNGFSIRENNFKRYWNQVTPENAGKWGSLNWQQLDNIYNFAKNNGFLYRHHTLVWGNQEPGHIAGLDSASQYQEVVNWLSAVGQRYPGMDYCDVVNEPLHAPPSYKRALGGDGATGWDWVIKAFELARQYLPAKTELHLNEYSVINDGNANARYIQIINLLKERGLIDGIGVQGHNFEVNGGASTTTLHNNLTNLAATGLPVYITEFDINVQDDNTQLQRYQTIFPVLYEHPGVYGITLWGYIRYEIWQQEAYLLNERLAERPAMQWLRTYLASPLRPALISPNGTMEEPRNPLLMWHPSESANSYQVQVATNRTFTSIVVDSTVADTLLQLSPLAANTQYYWRVRGVNEHGTSAYSTPASFTTRDESSAVEEFAEIPGAFRLLQNYPNPFNPVTSVTYEVGGRQHVSLKVYDISGREVATLVDESKPAGRYHATFDASGLNSGVYFIKLSAGEFVDMKRAVLIR
ncbi:endo-1,4-beta-xylanase [candidate division KSB1 bacterium]|nr:endo-1,4-beta-xylanase [candidate division KSB1 bacterium]